MTKSLRARAGVSGGAVGLLLIASAPAGAAKKPITGKLSKPGYTVIALAESGKAKAVRTKPRKFKVRPPANRVTLHLRAKDGSYAGPIVVARQKKGKRAILGVKAGAKLGKVKVKARKGYAKPKRKLAKQFVDAKRRARANNGVPIGAGRFGRVRTKKFGGGAPGDSDLDGIADPLDIDDDGDLTLDNLEGSTTARASQAGQMFDLHSTLAFTIDQTANVNAGSSDAQIDAALPSRGALNMTVLPGASAELDCGAPSTGLPYCRQGGTGSAPAFSSAASPFPGPPGGPYDLDGDGFGALIPGPNDLSNAFSLAHGATSAQIGTGNVLIQRVSDAGGAETGAFPGTLQYVFATSPALASYSDTAGNSGVVSYPTPAAGAGTHGNGFPVAAGGDGNVVLSVTFWRPQRRAIPPETGPWIDIGALNYGPVMQHLGTAPGGTDIFKPCPQSVLSSTDPDLTPVAVPRVPGSGGFTDLAADQTANPANSVTYTVSVTQCLASLGFTWNPGENLDIGFFALTNQPDNSVQFVSFEQQ
jgi:hypothetical protein